MTKILVDEKFGKNLQRIRKQKRLSQAQTTARLNTLGSPLKRSTYSLIELGRGNIYVTDLVALQKIFDVDYAEFFKGIPYVR